MWKICSLTSDTSVTIGMAEFLSSSTETKDHCTAKSKGVEEKKQMYHFCHSHVECGESWWVCLTEMFTGKVYLIYLYEDHLHIAESFM